MGLFLGRGFGSRDCIFRGAFRKGLNKMKITEHFDRDEFKCKCGCNQNYISKDLIEKLETLHKAMNAYAIVITSGYRCPKHSVAVGGSSTDAHTVGIAADCVVYKAKNIPYDVETVAEYAERLGFSGIGLMNGAIHLDIRNTSNYKNSHWYGDERTGNNSITTFQRENVSRETMSITIEINGKIYMGKVEEI